MSPKNFDTEFDFIPWATPEQHEAARAYMEQHAPDLIEYLWGER